MVFGFLDKIRNLRKDSRNTTVPIEDTAIDDTAIEDTAIEEPKTNDDVIDKNLKLYMCKACEKEIIKRSYFCHTVTCGSCGYVNHYEKSDSIIVKFKVKHEFKKSIKKSFNSFIPNAMIGDAYKKWTDDDLQLLVELYSQKLTVTEIAQKMNRSNGAISSQIKHSGLNQSLSKKENNGYVLPKNNLKQLQNDYQRIRSKIPHPNDRLYPEFEILVERIKNHIHPRSLETLKKTLEQEKQKRKNIEKQEQIEKELESKKLKAIQDKHANLLFPHNPSHVCGIYFSHKNFPEYFFTDKLTMDITENKKKFRDDQNAKNATERISQRMLEYIQKNPELGNIDMIIPVPNFTPPENSRAVSIGRELSNLMNIPCNTIFLKKHFQIPDHLNMNAEKRSEYFKKNQVYGVLEDGSIKGKKILLVDDIITTGETINQCIKQLFLGDPDDIKILCAGRTKRKEYGKF